MSKLRALIPLIGFLALAILLAIGLTRDPSELPSEMVDRPFPDFTLTELYDENQIMTEATMLGQVSLVNVFGSWCASCVVEHPKLMDIASDTTFKLVGMNWRDERNKGKMWLTRYGNPYELIVFDDTSQLAIDLGVTGAPETFIVDKAGNIRYKHTGIITDEVWEKTLRPIIKELAAAP